MKVVLAEKPSVARDLANYLGANSRHTGYYEGQGYCVTWALGHLVGLKDFDDYDPSLKHWKIEHLPFIPDTFQLKLTGDKNCHKQFGIIKKLFHRSTQLICATDAGREGELIFRYILAQTGLHDKPFLRLWLSSLTREAISESFENLKPGYDYNLLYEAARCRSQSDWIVGLNATRNYTLRYGATNQLLSVGRVQTPVLAMIVRRDDNIRVFKSAPYWSLSTKYRDTVFKYDGNRFMDNKSAIETLNKVTDQAFFITRVIHKKEKQFPPLLYDLTTLQRDMNRRFKLSAAKTLEIVQKLYELKLVTYPRTDSCYLSNDMKLPVHRVLSQLQNIKKAEIGKLDLANLKYTGRMFNNNKITDHHAIIPTGKQPVFDNDVYAKVFNCHFNSLNCWFLFAMFKRSYNSLWL